MRSLAPLQVARLAAVCWPPRSLVGANTARILLINARWYPTVLWRRPSNFNYREWSQSTKVVPQLPGTGLPLGARSGRPCTQASHCLAVINPTILL